MDIVYEHAGEEFPPFGDRFFMALHILFCGRCAAEIQYLESARFALQNDFLPDCPDFEEAIMACINAEEEDEESPVYETPGGIPIQGWVAVGLITFFSLAVSFSGRDFISIAVSQGSAFLLPLGITIGIVVSVYGAIFIGSHLKELSERFRLH
jgi:hypothetical protein